MDANGARFWLLAGPDDIRPSQDPAQVAWDARRVLVLSSQRSTPPLTEDADAAAAARNRATGAVDGFGSVARVEHGAADDLVRVTQEGLAEREIFRGRAAEGAISDVCYGADGVITVLHAGRIHLRDSRTLGDEREEWQALDVAALAPGAGDLVAWRAAPHPEDGAWILDRDNGRLAHWAGFLLRKRPRPRPGPRTFRPDPEDPATVALSIRHTGGFDGDTPGGIACSPGGRVAVLGIRANGDEARLHLFDAEGTHEHTAVLDGVRQPIAISWVGEDRVALLVLLDSFEEGHLPEALVYRVTTDQRLRLAGETYPLREPTGAGFVSTPDGDPRYPSKPGIRPLNALSLPHRATTGTAAGRYLDSGRADTCWHRLNIEARIPEGCGIRVELGASASHRPEDVGEWYPHHFGTVPDAAPRVPVGAWVTGHSELPGWSGLLHCPPELEHAGTFTTLIQRNTKRTTRLVGRYLHSRITLHGSGMNTPELAAVRAWAPRFSYVREYLPALYHEDPQVDGGDEDGSSTNADFFERFVTIFEGVLTPLEDKVAEAWQLTNPRTAPAEALDWLARWVGLSLDPALEEAARRRVLLAAPELSRWRGTLRGLSFALEVVTNGGITNGDIILLEEWRLRRTWATILGADLADDEDPLLGGLAISGNSLVGDTLILGDEDRREFLALFGEEVFEVQPKHWDEWWENVRDEWTVERFLEHTAHRVMVLVFNEADDEQFGLITRVVEAEAPAHVSAKVRRASRSFITGVTALVGVDTRFNVEPAPETVRLGSTRLGAGDRLRRPPSLHPDLEGEVPPEGDGT